jgi:hypothetical protein
MYQIMALFRKTAFPQRHGARGVTTVFSTPSRNDEENESHQGAKTQRVQFAPAYFPLRLCAFA